MCYDLSPGRAYAKLTRLFCDDTWAELVNEKFTSDPKVHRFLLVRGVRRGSGSASVAACSAEH